MNNLSTVLKSLNTLLCAGPGGVGKTTTSAAIAVFAAQTGRKVGLITIDPAKRLADSLGLKSMDNSMVDLSMKIDLPKNCRGSLHATMLNPRLTFLEFARDLGGKSLIDELEKNRLVPLITNQVSGTHEIFAFEKLNSLRESGSYDLLIVDTPPCHHFDDFFDAPEVLARLLEQENLSLFDPTAANATWTEKIRAKGVALSLKALEKVTGTGILKDFAQLVPLLFQMREPFLERQRKMQMHLRSKSTGVFLVFGSETIDPREFPSLLLQLQNQNLVHRGTILNRSLQSKFSKGKPALGSEEQKLLAAQQFNSLWNRETDTLEKIQEFSQPGRIVLRLPEMERNSDEICGLQLLAKCFETKD